MSRAAARNRACCNPAAARRRTGRALAVAAGLLLGAFAGLAPATAQTAAANTERLRELDFAPFAAELDAFGDDRRAAVGALVFGRTVIDVQTAMERGDLTSVDLTLFFLDRIRRFDSTLRSYVEINPAALDEARAADDAREAGGAASLLAGIPVSIKDNIDTAAPLHTTGGAEILLGHQPAADAPVVASLRAAKAVILGKANLSELAGAVAPAGFSAVGGQTGNPFGPQFSPLGSSSGSAAGVAGFLAMLSVGSETSGSLIAPASANGVVGLYPSRGLVPHGGVIPLLAGNDSAGPIGRTVLDVAALLAAIDTVETDYRAGAEAASLGGVRIGVFAADIVSAEPNVYEDTRDNAAILDAVLGALAAAGAVTVPVEESGIDAFSDAFLALLLAGVGADGMIPYLAAAGAPVASLADLIAYNAADPARRIPRGQAFLEAAEKVREAGGGRDYATAAVEAHDRAVETIEASFAAAGAEILLSFGNYHAPLYSTANYPAITIPFGLHANGRPVGVTLIGRPGSDASLLGLAYAFEKATGRRVDPKLD